MKTLIIGSGAAGNKAALTVIGHGGITKDDVVLINSTNKDIPKDNECMVVILSPDNSGCGKERSVAKEITFTAIQNETLDLSEKAEPYDIIVIVASVEGGTGSGSAPILAKYCNQMLGKNTHVVALTGFESDVRGLQNTVEFFQEIGEDVMVQTIQNKAFLKDAKGVELVAEQLANKELARRISILNGSMLMDSDHNIDSRDIYKVVNTVGYMTVEYRELTKDLIDTSDFDKICKQMIYESKSLKSTDPGQNRMAMIMNISPQSEDAVDYSFKLIKDTYGNPFECFMHKQYNESLPEFIAYIGSGMKMPLDEVKAVHERYMQETAKVNKDQDGYFDEVMGLKGDANDSRFDMGRPVQKSKVSKADFMSQFKKK